MRVTVRTTTQPADKSPQNTEHRIDVTVGGYASAECSINAATTEWGNRVTWSIVRQD